MRDLMLSLEAHQPKYYHPRFGSTVSRRTLVQQMKAVITKSSKNL
jgi:hypothetical protein